MWVPCACSWSGSTDGLHTRTVHVRGRCRGRTSYGTPCTCAGFVAPTEDDDTDYCDGGSTVVPPLPVIAHRRPCMSVLPVLSNPTQLHSVKLARERVEVPEWGLSVWVWELNGADLDAYRQSMYRQTKGTKVSLDLRNNTARLLTYALRDEDGQRVLDDHDGVHRLLGMGSAGLERLAAVARRLSGMDDSDEDAEGNSDAAPSGFSSSTSPSPSAAPSENSSTASPPPS